MLLMDICTTIKVGDGAGYLEDAGVGAGGEAEAVCYQLQHPVAGGVQVTVFFDKAGCHLGVAVDFSPFVALQLDFS